MVFGYLGQCKCAAFYRRAVFTQGNTACVNMESLLREYYRIKSVNSGKD